jgi:hypothetical protein
VASTIADIWRASMAASLLVVVFAASRQDGRTLSGTVVGVSRCDRSGLDDAGR